MKASKDQQTDTIDIIDLYQSHDKIHPKSSSGRYHNFRILGGSVLCAIYFGLCWLRIHGEPLVLFDLPKRQFHLFGAIFWPEDFFLLACLLVVCAFGLFFITNLAGRIWCGYACPQSVFSWIFIYIEGWVEGDPQHRIKLDKGNLSLEKCVKKTVKHSLWLMVALATALTFVGYFTLIGPLVTDFFTAQLSGWSLFWVFFLTLATYVNAGWMREQVCIYMCPYARFQSAMFDKNTLIISYDYHRGEPRGALKRNATTQTGDCIDCDWCVKVCPTGIDIRKGLQYECIGCAVCIDACDHVMKKINRPSGLIRYTTEYNLNGGQTRLLRPAMLGYLTVLLLMIGLFYYIVVSRVPLQTDIVRSRQALYVQSSEGHIQNLYELTIINKDTHDHHYQIRVSGLDHLSVIGKNRIFLAARQRIKLPLRLEADSTEQLKQYNTVTFDIQATDNPKINTQHQTRFIAPASVIQEVK